MAESQLMCMEDGHINANVPESKPEFYYSEEQRAAVEQLLKNGDGAFKTRLKEDNVKDFLSAREIKWVTGHFKEYAKENDDGERPAASSSKTEATGSDPDSGVHSTYWPQQSDTEVPPLDMGWPNGGFFRGVTRVAVHTHPPKDNGPHVKEVVRRLIQEANKVIAIVMDLLTDLQILQDLMDAAWHRSVPVYILLDSQGMPHFLDMFSRLQVGSQHLRNIRTRTLQGVGFGLSFGRLPGSLCNKYMLIDGDKVMFGSYSFSWCTSRMDRNMITVMTGQVVDFFDRDFRELYAISNKLDLYKEFHISPPSHKIAPPRPTVGPKRPPLPATTSRFQVSLGNSPKAELQVPAHKYHNPKYSLAFGDLPGPTGSLKEPAVRKKTVVVESTEEVDPGRTRTASSEKIDRLSPLPSEGGKGGSTKPNGVILDKKLRPSLKQRLFKGKLPSKNSLNSPASSQCPSPTSTEASKIDENEDSVEVMVKMPSKWRGKKSSKMGPKSESVQTVNTTLDNESMTSRRRPKRSCVQS
ncbi:protein FAM83F [Polymixia lowei]